MTTFDEPLVESLNFVEGWYGRMLPHRLETRQFYHFAATSHELARNLVPLAPMSIDATSNMAYTDGKKIYLPGIYFSRDFYNAFGIHEGDHVLAAILLINGSQVHEACHILLSDAKIYDSAKRLPEAFSIIKEASIFGKVLNIVEDVFIEQWCRVNHPLEAEFVDGADAVVFCSNVQDIVFKRGEEATKSEAILDVVLLAKHVRIMDDPRWDGWRPLVDIIERARNHLLERNDRVQIAVDLFRAIDRMVNPFTGLQVDGFERDNLGDVSENEQKNSGYDVDPIEQMIMELMGIAMMNTSKFEKQMKKAGATTKQINEAFRAQRELKKVFEEIGKVFDEVARKFAPAPEDPEKASKIKIVFHDIIVDHPDKASPWLSIDKMWRPLTQFLRYMRQVKHTPGRARTQGSKIVKSRLARIITDQKVLAHMDSDQAKRGKPEVIMLLDLSGSMDSDHDGRGSLWKVCTKACFSAYEALRQAGVSVAVYGHTSHREQPIVWGITAHNMPLMGKKPMSYGDYKERFERISLVDTASNYDGHAINLVSERFSSKPGSKLLMVFSDGRPSGWLGYGGDYAIKHTMNAVHEARRRGVVVLSMSLVSKVMEDNNKIYLPQFNIPAYGNKLDESLQKIVRSLGQH